MVNTDRQILKGSIVDDNGKKWNVNSLKDYFDTKFTSIERATSVAYEAMDKRLDGMNEFRNALKDQTSKSITRIEHDALIAKLDFEANVLSEKINMSVNNIKEKYDVDIRMLRESKATLEGKASQGSVNMSIGLAALGLLLAALGLIVSAIHIFVK
jgi:hypothetical protein